MNHNFELFSCQSLKTRRRRHTNKNIFSDRTALHLAAERGHTATVEFLADKFKASVFDRTKDGSTLMHIAALNGHPDTAMVLFKKGVPLLMPNRNGARGIHTAAMKGHVAVINSLLSKGENVDAVTNVMDYCYLKVYPRLFIVMISG